MYEVGMRKLRVLVVHLRPVGCGRRPLSHPGNRSTQPTGSGEDDEGRRESRQQRHGGIRDEVPCTRRLLAQTGCSSPETTFAHISNLYHRRPGRGAGPSRYHIVTI